GAHAVLKGKLARRMGELLHPRYKKEVWEEPACVSCHGLVAGEKSPTDVPLADLVAEGVGCVVCHGPYKEWVSAHQSRFKADIDRWRGLSRKEKEDRYGMADLWDPVKRAEVCLSCHLGNVAQGKVVTHAMYAAGHPPLPGVEVATFTDLMPKHWQYLYEKAPEVQKLLKFDADRGEREMTQTAVVAAAVALRDAMRLLADQAEAGLKDPGAGRWPELAHFDC